MSISFGGIVTGLDTNNMVSQLVSLERQPIRRLQLRQRALSSEISTLGKLSSAMDDLKTFLADFDKASDVTAMSATSSDEASFTASVTGEAQAGTYSIEVISTVTNARARSEAFADSSEVFGEGTLDIDVFGETTVSIAVSDTDTLSSVRDKINSKTDLVAASIIDTGNGAYLSINSAKAGHEIGGLAADALVINHSSSLPPGNPNSVARSFQIVQEAANAVFEIDGLQVERQTDSVDDVLQGTILELAAETTSPQELVIQPDDQKTLERFEAFVEKYNAVIKVINENSDEAISSREFAGSELRNVLVDTLGPSGSSVSNLASIGIEASRATGELSIDSSALQAALSSDGAAVAELFGDPTSGLANNLTTVIDRYIDSNGVIDVATESLQSRDSLLASQIERKERSVDRYEERLKRQFTQLETLTAQLRNVQSRFSAIASSFSTSQSLFGG